jgi:uncharacterized protein
MRNWCLPCPMITVRPVKGAYTNGYLVEGHAGFAPHGQDIVCSAVSALTQTTLLSLERYGVIEKHVESGNMQVAVPEPNTYTQVLINSMVHGLIHIERAYNQFLHVEKEKPHDKQSSRV